VFKGQRNKNIQIKIQIVRAGSYYLDLVKLGFLPVLIKVLVAVTRALE